MIKASEYKNNQKVYFIYSYIIFKFQLVTYITPQQALLYA